MDMILNRPETVAGLPSPLAGCKHAADWHNVRRPAILRLLEKFRRARRRSVLKSSAKSTIPSTVSPRAVKW